jgi:hypothetical protein
MQLVAYGAQDVYLTANPEITFFKVVYRRYTNFAIETYELNMTGASDFGKRVTCIIQRNGDLVTKMYLRIVLSSVIMTNEVPAEEAARNRFLFAWIRQIGNFIVDYVQFDIGSSQIDKIYGHWMSVWHDLTKDVNTDPAYNAMVGDVDEMTVLRAPDASGAFTKQYTLYVPLIFWCNTNTGLALPLIALQYHEVKLWIQFNAFRNLICHTNNLSATNLNRGGVGVMSEVTLLTDYIFCDTEERRRFAQVGHEYLINQLQYTGDQAVTQNPLRVTLNFNHPSKEFIWDIKSGDYISGNSPFLCYSNTDDWLTALDYAASNLITGSVTVGVSPGSSTSSDVEINISSSAYNAWNTVNPIETNTRNLNQFSVFTFQVGQGVDDSNTPGHYANIIYHQTNANSSDSGNFLFRRDVFTNPEKLDYNLGSYITKFAIIVYYSSIDSTGAGVAGTLTYEVKAVEHSITERDVSAPVGKWIDNRYSSSIGGFSDMDIWAYLPTVTGLLINNKYNPVETGLIQLNGHDRFDTRDGAFFHLLQTYQYHSSTPADGVNVYSFALHPEQHQPSGTCNLSRIDTTVLVLKLFTEAPFVNPDRFPPRLSIVGPSSVAFIYDTNYNVLRIMSGMGGLAYSN